MVDFLLGLGILICFLVKIVRLYHLEIALTVEDLVKTLVFVVVGVVSVVSEIRSDCI